MVGFQKAIRRIVADHDIGQHGTGMEGGQQPPPAGQPPWLDNVIIMSWDHQSSTLTCYRRRSPLHPLPNVFPTRIVSPCLPIHWQCLCCLLLCSAPSVCFNGTHRAGDPTQNDRVELASTRPGWRVPPTANPRCAECAQTEQIIRMDPPYPFGDTRT